MIRTRIVVGTILAAAATGVLVTDTILAPAYPFLLLSLLTLGVLATRELLGLLPDSSRPATWLAVGGVLLCHASNWVFLLTWPSCLRTDSPWPLLLIIVIVTLAGGFLLEMARYAGQPTGALNRIAIGVFIVIYLGVLPSFLAQLRFTAEHPTVSLALAIAVPKGNDIVAFFVGTYLGRHRMTPALSPKKTWEGFCGGMLGGAGVALTLHQLTPAFRHGPSEAIAFGLAVGLAGVFGDLAESLIKRECLAKDSSHSVPGFGGILDVVDSVLFAAPIAFLWLSRGI